mmetsp:Transcript_1039/g.3431  ORF Transcript_1039/g.3431 Transcript_1039/m.3431 type:complete len:268 (-) Transcript_1039:473-1276(-)
MTSWSLRRWLRCVSSASKAALSVSSASRNFAPRKSLTPSAPSSAALRSSFSALSMAHSPSRRFARWSSAMMPLISPAFNFDAIAAAVSADSDPAAPGGGDRPFARLLPPALSFPATAEPMPKSLSTRAKNARSACADARTPHAVRNEKTLSTSLSSSVTRVSRGGARFSGAARVPLSWPPRASRRRAASNSRASRETSRSSAGTLRASPSARFSFSRSPSATRATRRHLATSSRTPRRHARAPNAVAAPPRAAAISRLRFVSRKRAS